MHPKQTSVRFHCSKAIYVITCRHISTFISYGLKLKIQNSKEQGNRAFVHKYMFMAIVAKDFALGGCLGGWSTTKWTCDS